jgi:hypothetical protein
MLLSMHVVVKISTNNQTASDQMYQTCNQYILWGIYLVDSWCTVLLCSLVLEVWTDHMTSSPDLYVHLGVLIWAYRAPARGGGGAPSRADGGGVWWGVDGVRWGVDGHGEVWPGTAGGGPETAREARDFGFQIQRCRWKRIRTIRGCLQNVITMWRTVGRVRHFSGQREYYELVFWGKLARWPSHLWEKHLNNVLKIFFLFRRYKYNEL